VRRHQTEPGQCQHRRRNEVLDPTQSSPFARSLTITDIQAGSYGHRDERCMSAVTRWGSAKGSIGTRIGTLMYAEQGGEPQLPPELEARFAATFNRLCRVFRARGVPREESADLAQEAIARALMHLKRNGNHNENGSVAPLLNRIASNLLVDRIRANGHRVVSLEAAFSLDEPDSDPGEQVERLHDRAEVRRAIDELTERHRRAIMLSMQGMSPADIAAVFGIERNAADALLHRARRRLADRLRNGSHALRTLPAIALFKLRSAARRSARAARAADIGLVGAGQVGVNIATGVLGAILAISPVTAAAMSTSAFVAAPAPSSHAQVSAAPRHVVGVSKMSPQTQTPLAIDMSARDQRASAMAGFQDPSGRRHRAGVRAWHEREGDRGMTGPLVDQIVSTTCVNASAVCSVGSPQR
jgi:RNA polymerase sigma factor (sigma-70 family)